MGTFIAGMFSVTCASTCTLSWGVIAHTDTHWLTGSSQCLTSPCKLFWQVPLRARWPPGRLRCDVSRSPSAAPRSSPQQRPDCPVEHTDSPQQGNTGLANFLLLTDSLFLVHAYRSYKSQQTRSTEGNFSNRCSSLVDRDHLQINIEIKHWIPTCTVYSNPPDIRLWKYQKKQWHNITAG